MQVDIGDKISAHSIQGNMVTGNVTAILENTVILICGLTTHVVSKKYLKKQGYKFKKKAVRRSKSIVVSSNRNLKK